MLASLRIGTRLGLAFGAIAVIVVISMGIVMQRLSDVNEQLRVIVEQRLPIAAKINESALSLANAQLMQRDSMLTGSQADIDQYVAASKQTRALNQANIEAIEKLETTAKGKELLKNIADVRKGYLGVTDELKKLMSAQKPDEAKRFLSETLRPKLLQYQNAQQRLAEYQGELIREATASSAQAYRNTQVIVLVLTLALLAVIVIGGWRLTRSITQPLGGEPDQAKKAVTEIAAGNLAAEIPVKAGDTESLLAALRDMGRQLTTMIGEVKRGADGLGQSAETLSAASESVARSSADQSESAASIAAAVEQMTTSIVHVADSAGEARQISGESGERAESGKQFMERTASEMENIAQTVGEASQSIGAMGESSQRITGIVQVIKDVADQTNLLALNAAIEAARAGGQGRGFAVVADEVRKLAERTANATTEIGEMISLVQSNARSAVGTMERIVAQVGTGVSQAHEASKVMDEITASTRSVVASVNEISHALAEQKTASQLLASNVEKVAHLSEKNSLATQETAGAAHEIQSLASGLRQSVSRFRT